LRKIKKYYIAEAIDEPLYTAGIVRKDNEAILDSMGFIALKFRFNKGWSGLIKPARLFYAIAMACKIKKNSEVLFHFPFHAKIYQLLLAILKWKKVNTIAVIIDIDGLRDKNKTLLDKEILILKQFKYLVAHNSSMKNFLTQYLPHSRILLIGLFDYPFNKSLPQKIVSKSICIAANLSKSKYVYKLHQLKELTFNLYGNGYNPGTASPHSNVNYEGVVSPSILPAKLQGSFGLVWDGQSIEKCDDYLRYNNPHKVSLYLTAGLPIIVWEDSAIATLVKENGLGFTVKDLLEIPVKIQNISDRAYELMLLQVESFGEKIRRGFFLKKVIEELDGDFK
jgi:hypothetical protein